MLFYPHFPVVSLRNTCKLYPPTPRALVTVAARWSRSKTGRTLSNVRSDLVPVKSIPVRQKLARARARAQARARLQVRLWAPRWRLGRAQAWLPRLAGQKRRRAGRLGSAAGSAGVAFLSRVFGAPSIPIANARRQSSTLSATTTFLLLRILALLRPYSQRSRKIAMADHDGQDVPASSKPILPSAGTSLVAHPQAPSHEQDAATTPSEPAVLEQTEQPESSLPTTQDASNALPAEADRVSLTDTTEANAPTTTGEAPDITISEAPEDPVVSQPASSDEKPNVPESQPVAVDAVQDTNTQAQAEPDSTATPEAPAPPTKDSSPKMMPANLSSNPHQQKHQHPLPSPASTTPQLSRHARMQPAPAPASPIRAAHPPYPQPPPPQPPSTPAPA